MEEIIISVVQRTLVAGTPLLLGTIGEIISERSGILNLGVEGVMAVGAVTAFIVTHHTGNPWLGLCAAIVAGMLISMVHAFASVSLQSNQVVSGLALPMLGLGLAGLLGKPYVGKPLAIKINTMPIPFLSDIPIVGPVLFNQSPFFYLAILLAIGVWFMLEHTLLGIRIRSAGENPKATETQGVNVSRIRYLSVIAAGGFSAMAGAHLSTSYSRSWIEGMTAGRGWIVIALTIFALWNPLRAVFGAFLFGGIFVLQYMLQPLGISPNFLAMLPYLATLLVLLVGGLRDSRRLNAPAMLAEPYRRGER
ncbi:ABC transporter permease [Desulfosarcina sp.]|uniref:ABC transporter permease n=1 Tax=Desulfosarcina sp. TaxID=2027861 RepID=UPI0029A2E2EE|nr:ABC transporter permease [Desulfosarcina sp.]MDX2452655.1 ABC transporter permease [Desulfosarcina sp.]MDX2490433.1 ABC transporter permease [Desulfosarcina sp.]